MTVLSNKSVLKYFQVVPQTVKQLHLLTESTKKPTLLDGTLWTNERTTIIREHRLSSINVRPAEKIRKAMARNLLDEVKQIHA